MSFNRSMVILYILAWCVGIYLFQDTLREYYGTIQRMLITHLQPLIDYHARALVQVKASQYFVLPSDIYVFEALYREPNLYIIGTVVLNAIMNFIIQPVFLCVFTPQTVLFCILFPFFIYGSIKYFGKIYIMLGLFMLIAIPVGLRGAVVESLIRHRMICELVFVLIGVAGLVGLITENS